MKSLERRREEGPAKEERPKKAKKKKEKKNAKCHRCDLSRCCWLLGWLAVAGLFRLHTSDTAYISVPHLYDLFDVFFAVRLGADNEDMIEKIHR